MHNILIFLALGIALTGCEQLGLDEPAKAAAAKEAEGRAIGSACRHSGRSLEDCYALNKKASKAAIFTGWRDMDAYMRENNIEIIPPNTSPVHPTGGDKPTDSATPTGAGEAKPAGKQSSAAGKPLPVAGGRMV